MFNFILVSFCFFVNFRVRVRVLGLGLGIGLGFGIGNLKKIFDRWRWQHIGHPSPLDACDLQGQGQN